MEYGYTCQLASPPRGRTLAELRDFLARAGLACAPGIRHTALIRDENGAIIASASLEGDVVKCVAVDEAHRGEDLTAAALTVLRRQALEEGRRRLFLYTKPENRPQFAGLGFYEVARAGEAVLMEDRPGGFDAWAEAVRSPAAAGTVGAVVMNCDPMTLGHRHLVEQARARSDFLYILVVSEDRGAVPAADRLAVVRAAAADLSAVAVAGTDAYLISSATFPDYFLKDKARSGQVWADLDGAVFCRLAEKLGIRRRFVGTEPYCPVTAAYNRLLARLLPACGVDLVEIPRLERAGCAVSASAVRELLAAGRWREIRPLVPEAAWDYLSREENRARVLARMDPANSTLPN